MKNFARDYVIGLFNKVDKDGVIMLPAFDEALSCGEIMYDDQMLKCFVAEEPESVAKAADEFGRFAESLFEIGDWYSNSEKEYGSKPDEDFMGEEKSMDVWAKYIEGYKYFADCKAGKDFCKERNIKGLIPEYYAFMANRYCKYSALDAPAVILENALKELAHAYVINFFSTKVERIGDKNKESFF